MQISTQYKHFRDKGKDETKVTSIGNRRFFDSDQLFCEKLQIRDLYRRSVHERFSETSDSKIQEIGPIVFHREGQ